MQAEDPEWNCAEEQQQALVELHGKNSSQWHFDIVTMVQAHPSKFEILNAAKTEDTDYLYSFGEFASYFKGKEGSIHNEQLLRLMFDDMEKYDGNHVKLGQIDQWLTNAPEMIDGDTANVDATDGDEYKSRINGLEQENKDLNSKLDAKTKELEKIKSQFEEMQLKYRELLEEFEDEDVGSDESKTDRSRRGRAMRKRLQDEEAGGVCSMFPAFKDY